MTIVLVAESVPLAIVGEVPTVVKAMLFVPAVKAVQGAATELTANVRVVVEVVRVPLAGENVSPASAGVTTMVPVPVSAVFAVTVKVGDAPTWPEVVLQVMPPEMAPTLIALLVACMVPAQTVIASRPPNARALRFLNLDKSMEDLPFPWGIFSTTSRGGGLVFGR